MSVVRDFCGHGLGRCSTTSRISFTSAARAKASCSSPGMFFTVEPMINLGRPHVKVLSDGWTAVTRDRSLSAQFEHSVGVTETGVEIFTLSPKGYIAAALSALTPRPALRPRRLQNALIRSSLAACRASRGGTIATSRSIPWMQNHGRKEARE